MATSITFDGTKRQVVDELSHNPNSFKSKQMMTMAAAAWYIQYIHIIQQQQDALRTQIQEQYGYDINNLPKDAAHQAEKAGAVVSLADYQERNADAAEADAKKKKEAKAQEQRPLTDAERYSLLLTLQNDLAKLDEELEELSKRLAPLLQTMRISMDAHQSSLTDLKKGMIQSMEKAQEELDEKDKMSTNEFEDIINQYLKETKVPYLKPLKPLSLSPHPRDRKPFVRITKPRQEDYNDFKHFIRRHPELFRRFRPENDPQIIRPKPTQQQPIHGPDYGSTATMTPNQSDFLIIIDQRFQGLMERSFPLLLQEHSLYMESQYEYAGLMTQQIDLFEQRQVLIDNFNSIASAPAPTDATAPAPRPDADNAPTNGPAGGSGR